MKTQKTRNSMIDISMIILLMSTILIVAVLIMMGYDIIQENKNVIYLLLATLLLSGVFMIIFTSRTFPVNYLKNGFYITSSGYPLYLSSDMKRNKKFKSQGVRTIVYFGDCGNNRMEICGAIIFMGERSWCQGYNFPASELIPLGNNPKEKLIELSKNSSSSLSVEDINAIFKHIQKNNPESSQK